MTEDKWIHRAANMLCQSCMFYVPKKSSTAGSMKLGRCRRRCPTMNGWPVMYPTDWCGDHKLNESAPSDA